MRYIFALVDTSGSIRQNAKGQINDILEEIAREVSKVDKAFLSIITYGDSAKVHKDVLSKNYLAINTFEGRSNLGEGYNKIKDIMSVFGVNLKESLILLISDGLATDDYKKALGALDPFHISKRVTFQLDEERLTNEHHVGYNGSLIFDDKHGLIQKTLEILDGISL